MRMPGRGCKDEQIVQEGSADAPLPGVVRVAPFNRLKPGLETGCFTVRSSEGPGGQRRNMQGVVQGVPLLALMGCGDRLLPHQERASPRHGVAINGSQPCPALLTINTEEGGGMRLWIL